MVGRSVGQEKKIEWTLEGVWAPEKAGLVCKKSTQKRGLFDYENV